MPEIVFDGGQQRYDWPQINLLSTIPQQPPIFIIINSQAANLFSSREATVRLLQKKWSVILQQVPIHLGIVDNEKAEALIERGQKLNTKNEHRPQLCQTSHRCGCQHITDQTREAASRGEQWASLHYIGLLSSTTDRVTNYCGRLPSSTPTSPRLGSG